MFTSSELKNGVKLVFLSDNSTGVLKRLLDICGSDVVQVRTNFTNSRLYRYTSTCNELRAYITENVKIRDGVIVCDVIMQNYSYYCLSYDRLFVFLLFILTQYV